MPSGNRNSGRFTASFCSDPANTSSWPEPRTGCIEPRLRFCATPSRSSSWLLATSVLRLTLFIPSIVPDNTTQAAVLRLPFARFPLLLYDLAYPGRPDRQSFARPGIGECHQRQLVGQRSVNTRRDICDRLVNSHIGLWATHAATCFELYDRCHLRPFVGK